MKTIIQMLFVQVLGVLLFVLSAGAQTPSPEPTLDETLEFIVGKINSGGCPYKLRSGSGAFKIDAKYRGAEFTGTNGKFINYGESEIFSNGRSVRTDNSSSSYAFDLKDLSTDVKIFRVADRISETGTNVTLAYGADCIGVEIKSYNDKKLVTVKGAEGTEMESSFVFRFSDEETAKRFAKAFAHAIKLAGGKKESF